MGRLVTYCKIFLVPVTSRVFLAENVTVVPINHVINLTLSFIDCELVEHSAILRCCVLPMPETSLIVGLPHILFEFLHLFESMLRSARSIVVAGKSPPEPPPHAGLSELWTLGQACPIPHFLPHVLLQSLLHPSYAWFCQSLGCCSHGSGLCCFARNHPRVLA